MVNKRTALLFAAVLAGMALSFSSCRASPSRQGVSAEPGAGSALTDQELAANSVISTYIRTWPLEKEQQQGSPYWNAGMVHGEYLSDLNIAFALIDAKDKGSIYIPELRPQGDGSPLFGLWAEVAALKEQYPHLKVNISVGGWGAEHFSDMANDPKLRQRFVESVCVWLNDYNLDGVDIDWEYPVGPSWGQPIKSRPSDKGNYIALLRDLRNGIDALGQKTGKRYSLSTAVPAQEWFVKAIDVKTASQYADALKLMAYDYYGGWSSTTGHHCNIMKNPKDPNGWSSDQALQLYLKAGVAPEKMQMGLAFYGRAYKGVKAGPNGDGLFQRFSSIPFPETGGYLTWPQIQEFLKEGSGYTRYWDEAAQAPYLYNGDIWITYCDPQQIELLAQYSKEKRLGGFFSWEYATDLNAGLLKVLSGQF